MTLLGFTVFVIVYVLEGKLKLFGLRLNLSETDINNLHLALNENRWLFIGVVTLYMLLVNTIEELIYRYIPYKIIVLKLRKPYWMCGILTSMVFAFVHNLFGLTGLPIPQFLLGLVLWWVIKRGYLSALTVHLSYNLPIILTLFLSK